MFGKKPEPETKTVNGVIVRHRILTMTESCDGVFFAIKVPEGEGNGSRRDTVTFTLFVSQYSYPRQPEALLEKGDPVRVEMRKEDDEWKVLKFSLSDLSTLTRDHEHAPPG